MIHHGATKIIFKLLSNNDNSKQQVYLGGDFDVLRILPHGEMIGSTTARDGVIFKAPINLFWLSRSNLYELPEQAIGAQLIYYPRYPEVRLSGFLRGCKNAPSELMQSPTPEERDYRENMPRCLILGIREDRAILAYVAEWQSPVAHNAISLIRNNFVNKVASVFYEIESKHNQANNLLIRKLAEIYEMGPILSQRLTPHGYRVNYNASNAAGYTLESLFNIIPNGNSDPDFMGWELKAHSNGALTLMTPEPDTGIYRDDFHRFLHEYGRISESRRDFTGRHITNTKCITSSLTARMVGYDPLSAEIFDPNGGFLLFDYKGNVAAGWSFNKLISHWSKKHGKTAYVPYKKLIIADEPHYRYGPHVMLCQGAEVKNFLVSLYSGNIYYDPGVNQKNNGFRWTTKKRNQFRVAWENIPPLYTESVIYDFE